MTVIGWVKPLIITLGSSLQQCLLPGPCPPLHGSWSLQLGLFTLHTNLISHCPTPAPYFSLNSTAPEGAFPGPTLHVLSSASCHPPHHSYLHRVRFPQSTPWVLELLHILHCLTSTWLSLRSVRCYGVNVCVLLHTPVLKSCLPRWLWRMIRSETRLDQSLHEWD